MSLRYPFLLVLFLALCFGSSAEAQDEFSIVDVGLFAGDTGTAPILMTNSSGPVEGFFELEGGDVDLPQLSLQAGF